MLGIFKGILSKTASATSWAWGPLLNNYSTTSGEVVTHKNAKYISAHYACIKNISEDIGKLPVMVYENKPNGDREAKRDHPVTILLNRRPNRYMTAPAFRQLLQNWASDWGNGPAQILRDSKMNPIELLPIHPGRICPYVYQGQDLFFLVYPEFEIEGQIAITSGNPEVLPASDLFNIVGAGDLGYWGTSVLTYAFECLGLCTAAQKYGAAFYGNGASISGVLEHPGSLSIEARDRLVESWRARHGGAGKANGLAVLEEGLKFSPTSVNPRDAQALELRRFQTEEVARWHRMPLHKIQDMSGAKFNNIEQTSLEYVSDTLLPWTTKWEAEAEAKLLAGQDNLDVNFNFDVLLRGDSQAIANFSERMTFIGAMNSNEVRRKIGLNGYGEQGDVYYKQSAMVPVGTMMTNGTNAIVQTTSTATAAAFDSVRDSAAGEVTRKEEKAIATELKKDRDHAEWANQFFASQIVFGMAKFTPILTSMIQLGVARPEAIEKMSELLEAHYEGLSMATPMASTLDEIRSLFNATL